MPAYKSYCWSLGTTSFRMVEFNKKIERQLQLLDQFWDMPQHRNLRWCANNKLQEEYYEFIKAQGFIEDENAPRKDKDAREKTSGLVDLGLINDERRITPAGQALLDVTESGDFADKNILQLQKDSFIYFKQLLKLSCEFDGNYVRPYVVLAYMLSKLEYLTKDEFTYLLPLAISQDKTEDIIENIKRIRAGQGCIDDCIAGILCCMDNYIEAKKMFLRNTVTEDLIMEIGMNRKSRNYDKPYFHLYNALWTYNKNKTKENAIVILNTIEKVSGRAKKYWKQYIFKTYSYASVEKNGVSSVNIIPLFDFDNESDFKSLFLKQLHLFKAKSLLDDYYDLNKRYFKTSETVLFQDEKVRFDVIPNCYFSLVQNNLLDIAFTADIMLQNATNLSNLGVVFDVDRKQIFAKVKELYGVQVGNLYDIEDFVEAERYSRFNKMVDAKFTDAVILDLMTKFEHRDDEDIRKLVTNNADISTIFEYIVAIAWYKISERQGKILDYMNLSLDADLLPVTHAAGGHEDITYHYDETEDYPEHTLLLEVTLANKTNQRRMEMEPVSRHLGEYLLANPSKEAYCVFATTFLNINVISDFRSRKNTQYYSNDSESCVNGMKIIPCQTSEIKKFIKNGITYAQLYHLFENAYRSNVAPNKWHQREIIDKV